MPATITAKRTGRQVRRRQVKQFLDWLEKPWIITPRNLFLCFLLLYLASIVVLALNTFGFTRGLEGDPYSILILFSYPGLLIRFLAHNLRIVFIEELGYRIVLLSFLFYAFCKVPKRTLVLLFATLVISVFATWDHLRLLLRLGFENESFWSVASLQGVLWTLWYIFAIKVLHAASSPVKKAAATLAVLVAVHFLYNMTIPLLVIALN